MAIKPWARGPFELILHGELHRRSDGDFDRRIALVSFDNAIEVSIAAYLSLHPSLRGGRTYSKEDVSKWIANFHTKLDFLDLECDSRQAYPRIDRSYFVWYHDQRNDQYHGGRSQTPTKLDLEGVREAALWVFTVLFDIQDILSELENELYAMSSSTDPADTPNPEYDDLIDQYYDQVKIAGGNYRISEILFRVDPNAYREHALELMATEPEHLRIVS